MENILAYYTKDTNIYNEINNRDLARLKLNETGIKKREQFEIDKKLFLKELNLDSQFERERGT